MEGFNERNSRTEKLSAISCQAEEEIGVKETGSVKNK